MNLHDGVASPESSRRTVNAGTHKGLTSRLNDTLDWRSVRHGCRIKLSFLSALEFIVSSLWTLGYRARAMVGCRSQASLKFCMCVLRELAQARAVRKAVSLNPDNPKLGCRQQKPFFFNLCLC